MVSADAKPKVRSGSAKTGSLPNAANRQLLRRQRIDIHPSSGSVEAHVPIDQRKNRIVAAEPDILARQKFRPALADNDIAGDDQLASKFFNAQPFADAIAPVLYAALSFFVSHD